MTIDITKDEYSVLCFALGYAWGCPMIANTPSLNTLRDKILAAQSADATQSETPTAVTEPGERGTYIGLDHGKYLFERIDNTLVCLRHGQSWREFVGDKAVNALFDYACQAKDRFARQYTPAAKPQTRNPLPPWPTPSVLVFETNDFKIDSRWDDDSQPPYAIFLHDDPNVDLVVKLFDYSSLRGHAQLEDMTGKRVQISVHVLEPYDPEQPIEPK